MFNLDGLRKFIPEGLKPALRSLQMLYANKLDVELAYWKRKHAAENGWFNNDHYQGVFLAMAGEPDDSFLKGLTVADFGCGPRGSLVWALAAAKRIGIDVLASRYQANFAENLASHNMQYVTSTEQSVPLPDDSVDVLFSLNALDHTADFPTISKELLRIVKPNGRLILSFNLNEPPTASEPQTFTEELVREELLKYLDIESYLLSGPGEGEDAYGPLLRGDPLPYDSSMMGYLWVRARAKS